MSSLRYEVMYLLDAPDTTITAFKNSWDAIGDSIVVVGGEGLWNCHVHTNDIGAAIESGIQAGRPREIRVTDLLEQVEEEQWVRAAVDDADAVRRRRASASPPVSSRSAWATVCAGCSTPWACRRSSRVGSR